MKKFSTLLLGAVAFLFLADAAIAQQGLTLPRTSPGAIVAQTVGMTEVTITYHRPGVKGREIWGKLVPYGKVWRAGANENTTISFSGPVEIAGNKVEPGTYGFHILPEKDKWTMILSRQNQAWGSFSYDQSEDALRFTVNPQKADFTERLQYTLENPSDNALRVALQWENLRASFDVTVDVNTVVLTSIRNQLRGLPRFSWQGWNQAAQYCLNNDVNLAEATKWVERSVTMNKNFTNLRTKSGLLAKAGDQEGAVKTMEAAWSAATEAEVNTAGYQTIGRGDLAQAVEIFKRNVASHPDSWNVYDSLAEAYGLQGKTDLAIKNYSIALEKVKDGEQKKRINETLNRLKMK